MKEKIILCFVFFASVLMFSCKKQTVVTETGQLEINFTITDLKSASASDTITASTLSSVVVSIEDLNGKLIQNSVTIDLYNMNGSYISKPLSLPKGNYKLTRFLVLDWQNNVVYAAPLTGSTKAYLVSNPLPISFSVQTNTVTKISPEVLNAAGSKPEDFGYATFGFNVAQTFDFLIGTFIYNDTIKNFKLTSSTISVFTDTTAVFSGAMTAGSTGSLVSIYDSLGITNKITLPERYNHYLLVITKPGYKTFSQTYTKEELKLHLRSLDKGPLVVVLDKITLLDGLVAYYKFNGDVLDYSGNNNNGTFNGRGVYTSGYKSDANGSIDLNGSSDYVLAKSSASLSPTKQITLCGWYYSVPFYGNGQNTLIGKYPSLNSSEPDYLLGIRGSKYNSADFSFCINTDLKLQQINTIGPADSFELKRIFNYDMYHWYFITGTYDGITEKLYVNGELLAWCQITGDLKVSNDDVLFGKSANNRSAYDYLTGKIDEVRIYNRALSEAEILSLYQQ